MTSINRTPNRSLALLGRSAFVRAAAGHAVHGICLPKHSKQQQRWTSSLNTLAMGQLAYAYEDWMPPGEGGA